MNFKIIFFFIFTTILYSQISEHDDKKNYHYFLDDIIITGTKQYSKNQILSFIGVQLHDIIDISPKKTNLIIQKIWKTNLFSDINIFIKTIKNNSIILEINLVALNTLDKITIIGMDLSEVEKLKKNYNISRGIPLSETLKKDIIKHINQIYNDQGFYNNTIYFNEVPNTNQSSKINLIIFVKKGNYIKIKKIKFKGNHFLSNKILKSIVKCSPQKKKFQNFTYSIFNQNNFENDLNLIVDKYKSLGFREIKILNYIIKHINKEYYEITIQIEEGKCYYLGKIEFIGNKYYSDKLLNEIFDYPTGKVYNQNKILQKIYKSETNHDISTIYSNNGYLFTNINLIEKFVSHNSIDIKLIINEGKRAKWNKVIFSGNHTTYDHIIQRSLQTFPGMFFSQQDIQRTYVNLANLPFIAIKEVKQNIIPNPNNNTVDIHWIIKEKTASQIQLQGGYGAGGNFIGTVGMVMANFSLNNMFDKKAWDPTPTGEGQTIGFHIQNGAHLKNYSIKFIAPWSTNKPTTFSFGIHSTILSNTKNLANENNNLEQLQIFQSTIGLEKSLPYLDNLLEIYHGINCKLYKFTNYPLHFNKIELNNNFYHNLYYMIILRRNSMGEDQSFPTYGSNFNISLEFSPPYSLLNNINYSNIYDEKNYKYIEYYKLKIKTYWYTKLIDKLILKTGAEFGTLESYNQQLGIPMFERFFVGGSGLLHHRFDSRETITLRGYQESSDTGGIIKRDITPFGGGAIYNKFMIELRYPISKQSNKVYALTFIEAANTWKKWKDYKPFILNRTAGIGIRFFMPILGLIGLDLGYGFDNLIGTEKNYGWKIHVILGQHF